MEYDDLKIILGFILMVCLIAVGLRTMSHTYMMRACNVFAKESNRQVKFIDYSYWGSDCLTLQENGQWISTFNLRGE